MMYQGGKTKLAKYITPFLINKLEQTGGKYIEPFFGSGAITIDVCKSGAASEIIVGDGNPTLVDMWNAVIQDKWVPPTEISKEEHTRLKNAPDDGVDNPLKAFVATVCSYSGLWFSGYANDPNSDRNFAKSGSKSIVTRGDIFRDGGIKEVYFKYYQEYTDLIAPGDVVYADPPYMNTAQYKGVSEPFDSEEFWDYMRLWKNKGAHVFVSEFHAPSDFGPILIIERHSSTSLNNSGKKVMDKLFTSRPKGWYMTPTIVSNYKG